MNILLLNNYHFIRGGSDSYYFSLADILQQNGHGIRFFSLKDENNFLSIYAKYFAEPMSFDTKQSIIQKIITAGRMLYSYENKKKIKRLIKDYPVDIAHAQNIYHRVCPSVLDELTKTKIPVVMTLHDYKLGCPIYTFYRNGNVCTKCITDGKFSVFKNDCTKKSRLLSFFHWLEAEFHKSLNIYVKNIRFFICPSFFSLNMHLKAGIPEEKLIHIPNFIKVENFDPDYEPGDYILFVGRLYMEKGVLTLLKAVKGLDIELKIVGDGPLKDEYEKYVRHEGMTNVTFEGYKSVDELKSLYKNSAFVVFPSEWYEVFGLIILEASACGKPVIGSNIGAIPEIIINEKTGLPYIKKKK